MAGPIGRYEQHGERRRLLAALTAQAISLEPLQVYLFGSRSRTDYLEHSDWDLVFVSPCFAKQPFMTRSPALVWSLCEAGFCNVEVLCYTPEEFREKRQTPGPMQRALAAATPLYPPDSA